MIAPVRTKWLDTVVGLLDRGEPIPDDPSTVTFAIRLADDYRKEVQVWQDLVFEIIEDLEGRNSVPGVDT